MDELIENIMPVAKMDNSYIKSILGHGRKISTEMRVIKNLFEKKLSCSFLIEKKSG